MIPSLVVGDVRTSLVEFLASSFALADDDVRAELSAFLTDSHDGIFRGPYLRVRTPFVAVDESWASPLDWLPDGFRPYDHQARAFKRLSTAQGNTASPTLVTTGTGSGKTECFLMPLLDHCARERADGNEGIKALILYPMNALASDQAGRIAGIIHRDARLSGIKTGLYIGDNGSHSSMGADHVIDRREVLRDDPPDILLTNYKMLDFLLLRREDRDLWACNEPDTLAYVVLDEFHTYDGAQGTDVAMLLRRLGSTLRMADQSRPLGSATPVATSATLGTGDGAIDELRQFAAKIFGVEFGPDSVIGESRQSIEAACGPVNYMLPIPDVSTILELAEDDLDSVAAAFCHLEPLDRARSNSESQVDGLGPGIDEPVLLGERLLAHPLTRAVLAAVGERPRSWADAVAEVVTRAPNWGVTMMTDPQLVEQAMGKYLALLSVARRRQGEALRPLFSIEVQLWVREVSRLLRTLSPTPEFRWHDAAAAHRNDEGPSVPRPELPAVYCRRCGMSGWMAVQSELGDQLLTAPSTVYQAALIRSSQIRTLLRADSSDPTALWYDPIGRRIYRPRTGMSGKGRPGTDMTWADPRGADTHNEAHGDRFVAVHAIDNEDDARSNSCPACGERDTIRFLGLAVASMASVSINTLFGSPYLEENERKLLAFTDSVQDASHRASFFTGRTHRINLRSLMARSIVASGDILLADLGDEIWANAETERDRFGLIPPDLIRHPTVRTAWTSRPNDKGVALLRARLGFEVDLEFGLRSRVGRTLELSRAAAANVELADFDGYLDLIGELLVTLVGEANADRLSRIEWYVRGILERLRLRGAICHPLLDPYVRDGGRQWFIWGGRPDGLPPFTPGQGRPIFATTAAKGDFDSVAALSITPTWIIDWACRCLGIEPRVARDLNSGVLALLAKQSDEVVAIPARGGASHGNDIAVYGLARNAIRIWDLSEASAEEPSGSGLRCVLCGNRHASAAHLADYWVGTPCLRYRCAGRYEYDTPDPGGYYRRLYRSGRTRRVVAGEHTGLLARAEREALEIAFKTGTAADSPNVLTATPTLEMGIDIGDLSAVMLTSVPRSPASYIQRVGRAGRATGNALITTFVRTDSHGLYYLADPEAMLAGDVRPPNCYLDASEILQRHYIAFLMDRMADLTIAAPPVPNQIGSLMRDAFDEGTLLRRIVDESTLQSHYSEQFLELFGAHLNDESRDRVRSFAASGIEPTLKSAVEIWRGHLEELSRRRTRVGDAIKKLEATGLTTDEGAADLASLRGQRKAIIALLDEHRNEYTLSALERLGVLPNYTLIDDSATLTATLWSHTTDDDYSVEKFDITRPARLAVREFAPGNSFYAGGHRHVVDALEIGTAEQPLFESWRLCPECGFGLIEAESDPPKWCNRCRSSAIADAGSVHKMLRLRTALASSSEESARVYDEDDDRRHEQYDVVTTIDVDPLTVSSAWQLTDRVFGAELAGSIHLRTINLGFSDRQGDRLPIAGEDRHITRFTVCRHCGAVRDVRDDNKGARPERLHQGWCKARSGRRSATWDSLVLFHELTTEAVRILLPVSMFEVEERLASFTSALLLGLREDFGGDPSHLEVARADLPNGRGQGRRRFLVLYDRVPGGTGYIARLADSDRLRSILERSRDLIARCPCQTEGRAACHRCLLGVIERREYDLVRRDLAIELLDDLLGEWNIESIESVANIDIGEVEESELERRFKAALMDWAEQPGNDAVTLRPVPGSGRHGSFDLRITHARRTVRYRIDEQEGLGTTPNTVPDFVIRRMDERGRDVAVYLDGYQFHASPTVNNIARDAAQRSGIRSSGRLVWNITWDDVDTFHKAVGAQPPREIPPLQLFVGAARQTAQRVQQTAGGPDALRVDALDKNPVDLLLNYLAQPDDEKWARATLSVVAGLFASSGKPGQGESPVATTEQVRGIIGSALRGQQYEPNLRPQVQTVGANVVPVARFARHVTNNDMTLLLVLDVTNPNEERWTVLATLADDIASVTSDQHLHRWREWLHWANVLQFIDAPGRDVVITATSQADDLSIDDLWLLDASTDIAGSAPPAVHSSDPISGDGPDPNSAAIGNGPIQSLVTFVAPVELSTEVLDELDLLASASRQLVESVMTAGAPMFVAGLETPDGQPLEAGWSEQQVAVTIDGGDVSVDGWDIRTVSNWSVESLLRALKEYN